MTDQPDQGNQPEIKEAFNLSMIGEGKKYANVSDADKALEHSQNHITTLEAEQKGLRAQLQTAQEQLISAKTVEDVLSKFETSKQNAEKINDDPSSVTQQSETKPLLANEQVIGLVESVLNKRDHELRANSNIDAVSATLVEKFGDATKDVVLRKQTELGIDLKEIAAKSPKAALALFEGATIKPPQPNTTGSINTATLSSGKVSHYREDPEWKKAVAAGDFSISMAIAQQYLNN